MADDTKTSLQAILKSIGLSDFEMRVFIFLLESGRSVRATEIARKTRLNRTTLYGVLKSLTNKALVTSSEDHGVLHFASIEPHLLVNYVERLKESLTKQAGRIKDILPSLEAKRAPTERYRPRMQFFDGTEGIEQAYEDTLYNNKEKKLFGFSGYQAVYNLMSTDWIDYYLKKRPLVGVKALIVAANNPTAQEISTHDEEQLRETKFLPPDFNFDIELLTYDNKTMVVSFAEDHPWALIITDEKIAETIKALFSYIDSTLPSYKRKPLVT
jgi:sugar-specific transcriptional regulator TrmB